MNILWAHHGDALYEALSWFVAGRIGAPVAGAERGTAMAVADGVKIIAAVIYHNYQPDAGVIELSAASDDKRWLTRPVLAEMFAFPFDQLGCQAVVLRADANRRDLKRIFTAYGFNLVVVPRMRGRDAPEAIYVLGDDEWRANGFHRS